VGLDGNKEKKQLGTLGIDPRRRPARLSSSKTWAARKSCFQESPKKRPKKFANRLGMKGCPEKRDVQGTEGIRPIRTVKLVKQRTAGREKQGKEAGDRAR